MFKKKKDEVNLKLDQTDIGIILNGLSELRNKLIREDKDPAVVSEVILKVINQSR